MSDATYEQVLEYCRKRCLVLMDREFFEHWKLWPADMVQVVRCKDCKLWSRCLTKEEKQVLIDTNTDGVCEVWMSDGLMPNDFCSYGQRKEGEG